MAVTASEDDIRAVAGCLREAIRQKDVAVVLSLMTDDVVIVPPLGAPLAGLEAVRAALSVNPIPWKYDAEDKTEDVAVEMLGNVAILSSNKATVLTPENPALPAVAMQGRAIAIYRRQVNGWRLARYVSLMAPVTSVIS